MLLFHDKNRILFVGELIYTYTHSDIYTRTEVHIQLNQRFSSSVGIIYRVSREECARLRQNVSYVKVHRSNPKHLYPKLNGYGDNGERKVWSSCGSNVLYLFRVLLPVHCACPSFSLTAESSTFRLHYQRMSQLQ